MSSNSSSNSISTSSSSSSNLTDIQIFSSACFFAAEKHTHQRRKNKDKSPYINHPLEVAKILSDCGVTDGEILAGAVLHDTLEDTNTTEEELELNFNKRVLNLVKQCTDNKKLSKIERKKEQILHSKTIENDAKLIKLGDKISNLSSLADGDVPTSWSSDIIEGYYYWSYAVCINLLGINNKLDELIMNIFNKVGILNNIEDNNEKMKILEEKLEHYYECIKDKE